MKSFLNSSHAVLSMGSLTGVLHNGRINLLKKYCRHGATAHIACFAEMYFLDRGQSLFKFKKLNL